MTDKQNAMYRSILFHPHRETLLQEEGVSLWKQSETIGDFFSAIGDHKDLSEEEKSYIIYTIYNNRVINKHKEMIKSIQLDRVREIAFALENIKKTKTYQNILKSIKSLTEDMTQEEVNILFGNPMLSDLLSFESNFKRVENVLKSIHKEMIDE